jgi:D12 class N6 adenine-specific DNA methyltransferase
MFRKSPLNYVGGKFKLLPQLTTLFPRALDVFIDLFCGGMHAEPVKVAEPVKYADRQGLQEAPHVVNPGFNPTYPVIH